MSAPETGPLHLTGAHSDVARRQRRSAAASSAGSPRPYDSGAWLSAEGIATIAGGTRDEVFVPANISRVNTYLKHPEPERQHGHRHDVPHVGGRPRAAVPAGSCACQGPEPDRPEIVVFRVQPDGPAVHRNRSHPNNYGRDLSVGALDIAPNGIAGVHIQVNIEELWNDIIESTCDAYDCAIDP